MSDSKIEAHIMKITGIKPKKGEADQEWFERLIKGAQALEQDDWDKISDPGQKWINEGATAFNDDKEIADFPDRPDEDEEEKAPAKSKARDKDEEEDADDKPRRRSNPMDDEEADDKPKRRAARDADEDDDKPRRRTRDDDEEAAGPKRRARDDDEDDKPRRRARDDDEDDDKPRRRSRDADEEEDDVADRKKTAAKGKGGNGRVSAKDKDDDKPAKKAAPKKERGSGAQAAIKSAIIRNPDTTVEKIQALLEKKGLDATESSISSIRAGTLQTLRLVKEIGMPKGEI